MEFSQLSIKDIEPWADLLAVSFVRKRDDMIKLLVYLQPGSQLLAWGAWDGSRLAAQYSCLLRYLCLPGQTDTALVGMSINMAVHPDYRGQGLVKKVAQPVYDTLRERGGVAGVGFSNAAGVQVDKRSKGYGYHVVGRMQSTLACILRPPSVAPLHLTTVWPSVASLQLPPSRQIHFFTTPQTINGRFAAHPFRQYHYGVCSEDRQGQGVVVYKPFSLTGALQGFNQRCVSLLMAYGDNLSIVLAGWLRALWQEGIRFVHLLTTPHSDIREALRETAVCLPLPISRHPYYLTVKPLRQNSPGGLLDFNRWDCVGGDIL